MSKERIKIAPEMFEIMPSEYQDLVERATYGSETRGWKDIGSSKELIEEHFYKELQQAKEAFEQDQISIERFIPVIWASFPIVSLGNLFLR